jgi:hypothetical protein
VLFDAGFEYIGWILFPETPADSQPNSRRFSGLSHWTFSPDCYFEIYQHLCVWQYIIILLPIVFTTTMPCWILDNTIDIQAGAKIPVGKEKLGVHATVYNLTNTTYELIRLYPMTGRKIELFFLI